MSWYFVFVSKKNSKWGLLNKTFENAKLHYYYIPNRHSHIAIVHSTFNWWSVNFLIPKIDTQWKEKWEKLSMCAIVAVRSWHDVGELWTIVAITDINRWTVFSLTFIITNSYVINTCSLEPPPSTIKSPSYLSLATKQKFSSTLKISSISLGLLSLPTYQFIFYFLLFLFTK